MAIKVFSGGPDFKSLKREIDVVRSLPHHENIVRLENVEQDVSVLFFPPPPLPQLFMKRLWEM